MRSALLCGSAGFLLAAQPLLPAQNPASASAAIPDIRQLMQKVEEHQKQLEKMREDYTYSSLQTTEDLDANGHVTKTESVERNEFFVNGHLIERTVEKDGRPLNAHEEQRETERVTRLVEKAEKTPPGQPLEGPSITISRLLEIMDVRNPRRVLYRGRPSIVFDFAGRKNARTHGWVEDASKKLQGTMWVDEADLQVAHLEVSFDDNFHFAAGLLATVQKGSRFRFDQAPAPNAAESDRGAGIAAPHPEREPSTGQLWLPTGSEANVSARLLLVKGLRQHFVERDFDFKRFQVETVQSKEASVPSATAH